MVCRGNQSLARKPKNHDSARLRGSKCGKLRGIGVSDEFNDQ